MKKLVPFVGILLMTACGGWVSWPSIEPEIQYLAEEGVGQNDDWEPYSTIIGEVEMALVPVGCFMMGSNEGHGTGGEEPVHEVCFDELFWIDVYEVTQTQFKRFDGTADRESCFPSENRPRECITWFEAKAFCEKRGARLPTEAEWEYASRGPDALRWPWGNEFGDDNTVWFGNSLHETAPVGSKPGGRSWIGAYDLSGNVWEWVSDWYGEFYFGTLEEGAVSPPGPESGEFRVLRGGSWDAIEVVRRAGIRYRDAPGDATAIAGFRCARSP